eukprot:gnl/MRDRNA2_/MRDRNA2_17378_c0_seq2.p1 gnl/MRDRNA2_/MRDRNA2_17378_c0~~gnl/MRDRNA2_/MRDRNA2_17378_c0_seq2.p1  ORF type:complete len:302 (-),score=50.41 gnl/MRDRNA2_/MRDRNA2_17378_c0_seq2:44-949(-)
MSLQYVIPGEVVAHFVEGYEQSGKYVGFGHLGFAWQPLENRELRIALGAEQGGVLVKRLEPATPAAKVLKRHDVIMSIDGHAIGSGGTVVFRGRERIAFPYVVSLKRPGEEVKVEVLRSGSVLTFMLELSWHEPLVSMHPPQPPEYIIFGGLVFVPLSEPYLRSEWGDLFEERASISLVLPWLQNVRQFSGQQIVVLSSVLASTLTAGLTHFNNRRLLRLNGHRVRNLSHLAHLLDEAPSSSTVRFELDDDDLLCIPKDAAQAATAQVLADNLIPHARSPLATYVKEDQSEPAADDAFHCP